MMPPMIASPAFGVFPGNSRSLRSTGRRVAAVEPEDVHGLGVGGARQEAAARREGKTAQKRALSFSHFGRQLWRDTKYDVFILFIMHWLC